MRRFTSPSDNFGKAVSLAKRTGHERRNGSVAIEFLILAPLFLGLLLAFVEYTAIVSCEEKLCRASHAGCKAASHGASLCQIEEVVDHNLGQCALRHHRRISVCRVIHTHHGDRLEHVHYPERLPCGTELVVIVECDAEKVIPNLLGRIGFRLCDEQLIGTTTQCKD